MSNMKFNLIIALLFVSIASFAQSKKLVKSFKLGVVGYSLYETSKPSKAKNDTVFYSLFKAGKPKRVAKEVKSITNKSTGEKLMSANYVVNKNSIVFTQEAPNGSNQLRTYTQGINGILSLKASVAEVKNSAPMIVEEPKHPPVPGYVSNNLNKIVDTEPEFPGGFSAFKNYLANNIQYPAEAEDAQISGSVIVNFFVEKDGSLTNIYTERKLGYGCDEEIIRVFKKAPKWIPAKLEGKAVRYQCRMPIAFNLTN